MPFPFFDKFSLQNFLTSVLGNDMMKMQRILGKGVISMTKEEILEKSRKDNASGDEREKEIHREAS